MTYAFYVGGSGSVGGSDGIGGGSSGSGGGSGSGGSGIPQDIVRFQREMKRRDPPTDGGMDGQTYGRTDSLI